MVKKRKQQVVQVPRRVTRKEIRKEQRQLKKQAKCHYFDLKRNKLKLLKGNTDNQSKEGVILSKDGRIKNKSSREKSDLPQLERVNSLENNKLVHLKESQRDAGNNIMTEMKNQRKRQLQEANKDEEREIKILEKKLKLVKKKAVSSSKAFVESGLDYILDVCDSDKIHDSVASEVNFEDSDSDFFDDYSAVHQVSSSGSASKETDSKCSSSEKKNVKFNSNDSDLSDDSFPNSESSDSEPDCEQSNIICNDTGFSNSETTDSNINVAEELWEDIYGRLRDKKGHVLSENKGKYIPPHLRNMDNEQSRKRNELIKALKGLLNRLALNNIHSIANQIEELFTKNSRNSVNDALFNLYVDSIILRIASPERLIIDHAMLIAILHANVGSEIGAYMLQNLINKFNALCSSEPEVENKELDNLVHLVSYLYNFKVFEACLMYDILQKLGSRLTEKNIDLILVILKSVGFCLRKDDPLALKSFLLAVQKKVNQAGDVDDRSRMKFMLEMLLNIKNNNISKISDFDPAQHEHLKKVLKSVVRSGNSIVALQIGLEDLLKAEERGRWWLVGSAWNKGDKEEKIKKDIITREEFSAQLLALARKQKMNTENRRNIFCILMSAEDYLDAFEKILKLGLKGQQEREIPLVIIHCLLQENVYNPYYAHIADQLCTSNRRHQMSFQCALWDRFRALEKLSTNQISLLAKFLAQLLIVGSLPISVLKVVEFTELDKQHIRLLRQTMLSISNEEALDTVKQVFERVSKSKKLSLFREALRLFIHHFILRNMPDGTLKERVLLINSMLSGDFS